MELAEQAVRTAPLVVALAAGIPQTMAVAQAEPVMPAAWVALAAPAAPAASTT